MTEPTATVESSHHAFQVDANANVVLDSECGDLPLSPPLPLLPQHSAATKDGIADTGPRVPTPAYRVRPMQLSDVNAVLDLWKTYELYEGKHTIQTFMALDPQGFWVAEEQQTGRILGCCGGALVHSDTGFLGLYAVQPELQGRGIGLSMYNRVMQHFGDRNVGLYSLEKHLHTYRDKAGFKMQDTVQVIVYEKFNAINFDRLNSTPLEGVQVLPVTESWLPALLDYDESVVGHRREALLRLCLFEPESFGVLALQDSPPHSIQPAKVIGYGHVRLDNADKLMCGPLYASGQEVAERIMHRLLQDTPFAYNGLTLMVPDCVPNGHVIPDKLGLPALYWLPRLFTRHLPVARFEHIYGIHSPNFYPF